MPHTFNGVPNFCHAMKSIAGDHWYVGGGFAAYWHILNYGKKDQAYFDRNKRRIIPGDLEGSMREDKFEKLKGVCGDRPILNYGEAVSIEVKFDPVKEENMLDKSVDDVEKLRCLDPATVKIFYEGGGDPNKLQMRQLRSAMLQCIIDDETINEANVNSRTRPSIANQIVRFDKANLRKTGAGD